jgi:hypothetical protein
LQLLHRAVVDGLDIVYARPWGRVHRSVFRDLCSRWLKRAVSLVVGTAQVQAFNSFRLVRGSIARAAASVSSHDSYLDVVLCWFSTTYGTVPLPLHDGRATTAGSGYTVIGLFSHARRLLVSSQTRWLRLGAGFGFLSLAVSAVLFLVILLWKLIDPESIVVRGWSSLFLAITFFGGLGSFLLGVVLEYLSTLILHTQGKPTFFAVDRSGDADLKAYLSGGDADAAASPPTGH